MNRRLEKKLKNSLEIILPTEKDKQRKEVNLQFGYIFTSLILACAIFYLMTPSIYFNEGIHSEVMGVKTYMEQEVHLEEFPWKEKENITYQYQQQGEKLQIIYQSKEQINVTITKDKLLVESDDRSTQIGNDKIYFYQQDNLYQARWQYQDFVITVQSTGEKSHFMNEIKTIIKENLA